MYIYIRVCALLLFSIACCLLLVALHTLVELRSGSSFDVNGRVRRSAEPWAFFEFEQRRSTTYCFHQHCASAYVYQGRTNCRGTGIWQTISPSEVIGDPILLMPGAASNRFGVLDTLDVGAVLQGSSSPVDTTSEATAKSEPLQKETIVVRPCRQRLKN